MPLPKPRHANCLIRSDSGAGLAPALSSQRFALAVEYDGSVFYGWQKQLNPALPTVQQALEQALSRVADHPVAVICAGRTDAGVHGLGQVVHFDTVSERPLRAWVRGTNAHLPPTVRVLWAQPVADDFHARFTALARHYRYRIRNRPMAPALGHQHLGWEPRPLDAERMHQAGQALLGEQDFTSFRAAGCQSNTPMRCVTALDVRRVDEEVWVDISANAFLLHMVRNIVGSLLVVGRGDKPADWLAELLALRDRNQAAPTAAPQGLYLSAVSYPACHALPWPVRTLP